MSFLRIDARHGFFSLTGSYLYPNTIRHVSRPFCQVINHYQGNLFLVSQKIYIYHLDSRRSLRMTEMLEVYPPALEIPNDGEPIAKALNLPWTNNNVADLLILLHTIKNLGLQGLRDKGLSQKQARFTLIRVDLSIAALTPATTNHSW
jgi:hypothetical protein